MESLIKVENIEKDFTLDGKSQLAFKNISFGVKQGEFVCIVGPSGCGKSTLLRIISGLDRPSSGRLDIPKNIKLSMVFQNFALFPWLTVQENVSFGLKMAGEDKASAAKKAEKYIHEMGLSEVIDKHPKELSGGMKQRVGIARALAVEPNLLLLDEPFSALDVFTANKLRTDLLSIWSKSNITILMVSHLIEEAVELADKVIVLSSSPGQLKSIEEINLPRPRDTRSDGFYKYIDKIQDLIIV